MSAQTEHSSQLSSPGVNGPAVGDAIGPVGPIPQSPALCGLQKSFEERLEDGLAFERKLLLATEAAQVLK